MSFEQETSDDPLDLLLAKESNEDLFRFLKDLPYRQMIALVLYFGLINDQQRTYAEIGEIEGISAQGAHERVQAGLKNLRKATSLESFQLRDE